MQSDFGFVHIVLIPSGLHFLKPWYMQLQKFIFALVWWSKSLSSQVLRSFLPTQLNPPWRHIAFLELLATYWSNERILKRVNLKTQFSIQNIFWLKISLRNCNIRCSQPKKDTHIIKFIEAANLRHLPTGPAYQSHGLFKNCEFFDALRCLEVVWLTMLFAQSVQMQR